MRHLSSICLAMLAAVIAVQPARAQTAREPAPDPIPLVGPIELGDVVDVSVFGGDGPGSVVHKRVRVAADGTASLYWMDNPVKLVGLDTSAAAKAIRKAYADALFEDIEWIDVDRVDSAARNGIAPGPLEPGDLVELTIASLFGPGADSTHLYRIERDGQIALPYVGLVHAGGLDERGLEAAAGKAYRDANLIQHAAVAALKIQPAAKATVKAGPIETGDLLQIAMSFPPLAPEEVSFAVRVGADGRAPIPLAGAMKLAGSTAADVAVEIVKARTQLDPKSHEPVWVLKIESGDRPSLAPAPIAPLDAVEVVLAGVGPGVWKCSKRVAPDGTLRLPYIGQVSLTHLSEADAQRTVVEAYEKLDPTLHVHVAFTIRRLADDLHTHSR